MRGYIILLLLILLTFGASPAGVPGMAVSSTWQGPAGPRLAAGLNQGAFLILTDIHFDPFADPAIVARLAASPVDDWPAILQSSRDSAISRGPVDAGYPLLKSAINAAKQAVQNSGAPLDYVMNNGDFLAHNFGAKYAAAGLGSSGSEDFAIKTMVFVSRTIQDAFPGKPVISAFGNNDSTCGDYFAPGDALLAALAKEWKAVAADRGAAGDFAAGGYYAVPRPVLPDQELIVLNTTFWSSNYHVGCSSRAGDQGALELRWLGAKLGQLRAARKTASLILHIPPGVDSFATARRADCTPSAPFWKQQYLDSFLETVREYKDVLRDAYAGHTHHDDFRVLLDSAGAPFLQVHVTPSVSPVYSNNPAFEIARYDKRSGALADYSVVYLRNYFDPGGAQPDSVPQGAPQWEEEYDFHQTYSAASDSPAGLEMLARAIGSDPAVRAKFEAFYGVRTPRPPDITENNWRFFSCAQTETSAAGYGKCACPVPAPR